MSDESQQVCDPTIQRSVRDPAVSCLIEGSANGARLSLLHNRYIHLTSLRTMSGQRFTTIVGGCSTLAVAALRFGDPSRLESFDIGLVDASLLSLTILLVAFCVGCGVLAYDGMIRKVAKSTADAIQKIASEDKKLLQVSRREYTDEASPSWPILFILKRSDEELLYISNVLLVTSFLGAAFCGLMAKDIISIYVGLKVAYNFQLGFTSVVFLGSFLLLLSALSKAWRSIFQHYEVDGWGAPSSLRGKA